MCVYVCLSVCKYVCMCGEGNGKGELILRRQRKWKLCSEVDVGSNWLTLGGICAGNFSNLVNAASTQTLSRRKVCLTNWPIAKLDVSRVPNKTSREKNVTNEEVYDYKCSKNNVSLTELPLPVYPPCLTCNQMRLPAAWPCPICIPYQRVI